MTDSCTGSFWYFVKVFFFGENVYLKFVEVWKKCKTAGYRRVNLIMAWKFDPFACSRNDVCFC